MNLTWVIVASLAPVTAALAVAWPFWKRRVADEIGSIAGSAVVLCCALGFFAREFAEVMAFHNTCLAAGKACHFSPEPFTRYAIYAGIGMLQVFVVFVVGLRAQERGRGSSPPPAVMVRRPDD